MLTAQTVPHNAPHTLLLLALLPLFPFLCNFYFLPWLKACSITPRCTPSCKALRGRRTGAALWGCTQPRIRAAGHSAAAACCTAVARCLPWSSTELTASCTPCSTIAGKGFFWFASKDVKPMHKLFPVPAQEGCSEQAVRDKQAH